MTQANLGGGPITQAKGPLAWIRSQTRTGRWLLGHRPTEREITVDFYSCRCGAVRLSGVEIEDRQAFLPRRRS